MVSVEINWIDEYDCLFYRKSTNGIKSWFEYDEHHRLISYKNSLGVHYQYEYDENGDLIKFIK